MTIQLKPEQEQLIGRAIQAGLIQAADDVLDVGVEAIRRQLEEQGTFGKPMDAEQWSREFHAWVQSHSTTTPLLSDDAISRDSIYGTRGMKMAVLTDTKFSCALYSLITVVSYMRERGLGGFAPARLRETDG